MFHPCPVAGPGPSSRPRAFAIIAVAASALAASDARADSSLTAPRPGDPGMPSHPASLLVEHFERFLRDQNLEGFRRGVEIRYEEGTLGRLTHSGDLSTRRAAVLALGLFGTFASNPTVARMLKDPDPTVRSLATNALWAIWGRADTAENIEELEQVRGLIDRRQLRDAVRRADLLVARAPNFAEAINQRAIARYLSGELAESAADCRRVLELNPYHIGALSGLGQCQLGLRQRADAIRTFRKALEIQPYSDGLRATVAELEAAGD